MMLVTNHVKPLSRLPGELDDVEAAVGSKHLGQIADGRHVERYESICVDVSPVLACSWLCFLCHI